MIDKGDDVLTVGQIFSMIIFHHPLSSHGLHLRDTRMPPHSIGSPLGSEVSSQNGLEARLRWTSRQGCSRTSPQTPPPRKMWLQLTGTDLDIRAQPKVT